MVSAVEKLTVEKICGEKSHHGKKFVVNLRFLQLRNKTCGTARISVVKSLYEHHYSDIS